MADPTKVLIIDDDTVILQVLQETLAGHFPTVNIELVDVSTQAIAKLQEAFYALVLCDYHMPGMSGMTILKIIQSMTPGSEVIMLMEPGSEQLAVQALEAGAYTCLAKPIDHEALLAAVGDVLRRQRRFGHVKDVIILLLPFLLYTPVG